MNIIEAIKERRSVRNFNGEPLNASIRRQLLAFANEAFNPFGGRFTIRLKEFDLTKGYRPSTYGMIKGAVDFFLIGIDDSAQSALAVGFCFEQVVLKARQIGLGTCWVAGTFKESSFLTDEPWPEKERLRIVCPVGVASHKSIMEKITRLTLGSRSRKPFGELFFSDSFRTPLNPESRYGEALEMMRLAPSSKNSQPWRVLVEGEKVHFYYVPKSEASILDCGIGICHFYETEKFNGHDGTFVREDSAIPEHLNWKYLVSYIPKDNLK